jgi:blocked-early-in-transport protein 1
LNSYAPSGNAGFSAYPAEGSGDGAFRSATPNRRGQYSDAVLSELESQNDDQAGEMSKKVKMLKEVSGAWIYCEYAQC